MFLGSGPSSGANGYSQAWLRGAKCRSVAMTLCSGPGNEEGHAHEGIELADGKGFVAVRLEILIKLYVLYNREYI